MVWRFKVEKVGLGSYYGFKVDKNERILLADLTVSHNVSLILPIFLFIFFKKNKCFIFDLLLINYVYPLLLVHKCIKDLFLVITKRIKGPYCSM
jgi:hypothetical protein